MSSKSLTMPDGYSVYGHQVAGHRFETGKQGMLLDPDGRVLKPIQPPPRGEKEVEFYERVFGCESDDEIIIELRRFVPAFYGIKHVTFSELQLKDKYIIMENLAKNFRRPCILDVKIGTCITDHLATEAKQERALRKYPEQKNFGFRILGMKVYQEGSKTFQSFDKEFGKRLKTHEDVLAGLDKFFQITENGKEHVMEILQNLSEIHMWSVKQRTFKLFSSSILFIYEGETRARNDLCTKKLGQASHCRENGSDSLLFFSRSNELGEKRIQEELETCFNHNSNFSRQLKVCVKMVDFAHTYVGNYKQPDNNYIEGLTNLMNYLNELIR